jgi:hypothetical protein
MLPAKPTRPVIVALALVTALAGMGEVSANRQSAPPTPPKLRNPFRAGRPAPGTGPLMQTQNGSHLDANQYQQIRDASIALMTKFPPKEYFYVGVGRSPAPIIAFLENLAVRGDDVAINFPASGVRSHDPMQHKDAYYAYFDALLPRSVIKGQRKILLIDRAGVYSQGPNGRAGGSSLVKVRQVLQAYLKDRSSSASVEAMAYAPYPLQSADVHRIDTAPFREVEAFGSQLHGALGVAYDEIARHPENDITQSAIGQLQRNPAYDTYRAKTWERMQADPTLGGFLSRLGVDHQD